MKRKILISGTNQTLVKDFFMNTQYDNMYLSTSEHWEDVKGHFQVWAPDAYVCLIEDKSSSQLAIIKNLSVSFGMRDVPVVVITNEEFYPFFAGGLYDNLALVLCKPITIGEVLRSIQDMLKEREKIRLLKEEEERKKQEEEELKKQEEAAREEEERIKNILVVDDDKNILKLLKAALDDKYNVATMITGKMAVKYLESRPCDLILLDYEMPVENGPEVFRKIKEIESAKDIPIIFLTGVAEKEKIAEVLRLKPQGYLLKPIDMDKLLAEIEKNIG